MAYKVGHESQYLPFFFRNFWQHFFLSFFRFAFLEAYASYNFETGREEVSLIIRV